MIDEKTLKEATIIEKTNLSIGQRKQTGQWDNYTKNGVTISIATDRVAVFNRIIGTIPFKGVVLAETTAFFAELAADICQVDFITRSHQRMLLKKNIATFPVSYSVYGYITNENGRQNMWEQYKNGIRNYFGNLLQAGLRENQKLDNPIVVPIVDKNATTKETVFAEGLVDETVFEEAVETSLKLFTKAATHAAKQGLILAYAKYKFGIAENQLVLLSGFHIPGTATYWYANEYNKRFASGEPQRKFIQTVINDWLHAVGFEGNGPAPPIPEEIRIAAAKEYIALGEHLIDRKIVLK